MPGSPWAICITPGPHQVLYSSDAFPGRIYKLILEGKVLGSFGKSGNQLGQWIHEIACPSENELYVAEILNWRAQKIVLEATHWKLGPGKTLKRDVLSSPSRSMGHGIPSDPRISRRSPSGCGTDHSVFIFSPWRV